MARRSRSPFISLLLFILVQNLTRSCCHRRNAVLRAVLRASSAVVPPRGFTPAILSPLGVHPTVAALFFFQPSPQDNPLFRKAAAYVSLLPSLEAADAVSVLSSS